MDDIEEKDAGPLTDAEIDAVLVTQAKSAGRRTGLRVAYIAYESAAPGQIRIRVGGDPGASFALHRALADQERYQRLQLVRVKAWASTLWLRALALLTNSTVQIRGR